PHELACDYRYGMLWITDAARVKDWHDPTGVADLKAPSGSMLGRVWNEPMTAQFYNQQLSDVLKKIVQRLAIQTDTRQVEPGDANAAGFPITVDRRELRFHDLLGHLLYKTGCRCEL